MEILTAQPWNTLIPIIKTDICSVFLCLYKTNQNKVCTPSFVFTMGFKSTYDDQSSSVAEMTYCIDRYRYLQEI